MRRLSLISLLTLSLLGGTQMAFAAGSDEGFVLNKTGTHFYALPVQGAAKPGIALNATHTSGFVKLDRNRDTAPRVITPSAPAAKPVAAPATKAENDRNVLNLFENELGGRDTKPVANGKISYLWPVPSGSQQHLSSGFGMRTDPFTGGQMFHGGIDIAANPGTPVIAAAAGVVKESGYNGGYGNSITLTHADGSETMYNHLQKLAVMVGTKVYAGQQIGEIGSTGHSTGPHLDFRLSENGAQVNPMIELAGKEPIGSSMLASTNAPARASAPVVRNGLAIRVEHGVRIITPQQRVAMGGGFIQVH